MNSQNGEKWPQKKRGGISPRASILWALVPFFTLGWGTGLSFSYAAYRLRNWTIAAFAGAYLFLGLASLLLLSSDNGNDWQGSLGALIALALMAFGTAHAFGIRWRLTGDIDRDRIILGLGRDQGQAIAEAKAQILRRQEARKLLACDPILARQLCIGRPDLARQFDDGGLVDANHASAGALAQLPGIGPSIANKIVVTRDGVGGFIGLDDLSLTLGISPTALDEAAEFLVFRSNLAADGP